MTDNGFTSASWIMSIEWKKQDYPEEELVQFTLDVVQSVLSHFLCPVWENGGDWQHAKSRLCAEIHFGLLLWRATEPPIWLVSNACNCVCLLCCIVYCRRSYRLSLHYTIVRTQMSPAKWRTVWFQNYLIQSYRYVFILDFYYTAGTKHSLLLISYYFPI